MKKILYITALAAMFAACTADMGETPSVATGKMEAVRVAIDNEVESRNSLVDEAGKRFILWSDDDVIGVSSTEGLANAQGVIDYEAVGKSEGKFWSPVGQVKGDIKFAYYPYNSTAKIKDYSLVTILPNTQKYMEESVFAPNITVMAGKMDTEGVVRFVNTCSILEFRLLGTQHLSALSLYSHNTKIAGYARVDMAAETPILTIDQDSNQSFNEIVLDLGYGVQLSATEPTSFYFVVPSGTYSDLSLVATDSEGVTYTRDIINARTVAVRHIAPFNAFEVGEILTDNAINLSDAGVSNCYMVSAVKGGRYYLEPKNIANNIDAADVETLDVLWYDKQGIVGNTYFDKENKRFYFTTHGANDNGSAIVAAFDKDNKVLWSWHIWVSEAIDQTCQGVTLLDRNLGAREIPMSDADVQNLTSATAAASCGFYYQLGRSNPFPGPKSLDSFYELSNFSVMNKYGYENTLFSSNTTVFVNEKYKEEYKFKNEFFSDEKHTIASCAATPMSLWHGDTMEYLQTWASDMTSLSLGGSDKTWSATKKGEQDPCPQGYRAATYEECKTFFLNGASAPKYSHWRIEKKATVTNDRPSSGSDTYGGYFTSSDGSFVWLPYAGLRISYLKNGFDITDKAPSQYAETGKLYYTGMINYPNESNPSRLVCGYAYLRGVVTNTYEIAGNIHSPGGWTRYCSADVVTPSLTMTQTSYVKEDVASAKYKAVPFASAAPVRCVKMQ